MMQDAYPRSQMHVERRGSGPTVVFVHGGEEAGGSAAFASQLPLAHTFTLIWPDLPGHGQSPAQGRKNVERDALLIADLLEDGAHLVGHSYGGAVALRTAAQRPEAVRSLTLIEPATLDIARDNPDVRQLFAELAQAVAIADPRQRLEAFATAVGIHKTWQDPLPETYRRLAEDLPFLQSPSGAAIIPSRQLAEQVAAAGIPSLVISGGHSAAFENICDVVAGVLGAERAVVSGYGHAPQQSGEPFNTCLERFWSHLSL
jgi:pimeloyl-ACP methyl ester carboxylesterase